MDIWNNQLQSYGYPGVSAENLLKSAYEKYPYLTADNNYLNSFFLEKGDWFKLTIGGSLEGQAVDATVDFYLAQGTDFVTAWTYVDLSKLGKVDELNFTLTGSRTGDYGLNTPAYFCIDDLGAAK